MAASDLLDIWNAALLNATAKSSIASLTEQSAEAAACALRYPSIVAAILRDTDWNCVRRRVALDEVAEAAVWPPSWSYMYLYPTDCLRVRGFDLGLPQAGFPNWTMVDYEIADDATAGKSILLNVADPVMIYTSYELDLVNGRYEAKFDASLREALGWALGGRCCRAADRQPVDRRRGEGGGQGDARPGARRQCQRERAERRRAGLRQPGGAWRLRPAGTRLVDPLAEAVLMAQVTQPSFAAGELSPSLYSRTDLAKYHIGVRTMLNWYVHPQGGASIAPAPHAGRRGDRQRRPGRLIGFQFSTVQTYVLEFGDLKMRVIKDGGYVLETAKTVTAVTKANPGKVTTSGNHGFASGDRLYLAGLGGMVQLNGRYIDITVTSATEFTVGIDTSGFTSFTSGGTAARLYTLATPYPLADLATLKYEQSADTRDASRARTTRRAS